MVKKQQTRLAWSTNTDGEQHSREYAFYLFYCLLDPFSIQIFGIFYEVERDFECLKCEMEDLGL